MSRRLVLDPDAEEQAEIDLGASRPILRLAP